MRKYAKCNFFVKVIKKSFQEIPKEVTVQIDGEAAGTEKWQGGTEQTANVSLPEAEGYHTVGVKVKDELGFETSASKEILVDRTAPVMPENEIIFEETDEPLLKENGISSIMIPSDDDGITEKQLIVHITASDALSGIDKITAAAGGRIYIAEKTGENSYTLRITHAFRGQLAITAYDKAGNTTEVQKYVNVDDNMPMGDILTGEAETSYTYAVLHGSVTTEDEFLAEYGIEYRAVSDKEEESWIAAKPAEDASRNDFSVTVEKLLPGKAYEFRVFVRNAAGTMHYGQTKTFYTRSYSTSYIVNFDTQGGSRISTLLVSEGGTVTKPKEPVREGYIFEGWFIDEECTKEYDFRAKVTDNITLYAKWTALSEEWENPFTDVDEDDWFYDDVRYVCEKNLFSGVIETMFAPNRLITRGMLVTVLYRAENSPETELGSFRDLAEDSYYAKAVGWAAANGIVQGHSKKIFAPDDSITREQIAAILECYAEFKKIPTEEVGDIQ